MRVTLKLFASLSPYLPAQAEKNSVGVEAAEGETISSLLDRFSVPRASRHLVLLNGLFQHPSVRDAAVLADGDAVSVWPPVAGG